MMAFKDTVRSVFQSIEHHHIMRYLAWRKRELTVVEWKNVVLRRDEWKKDLSPEQKDKVDAFYLAHYGRKIPYYWHRMYTNYTGNFDERFFPEILFSTKLEEKLNPYQIAFPLQNKAFSPQKLFGNLRENGVVVPEMLAENCSGIYWMPNGVSTDESSVCRELANAGEVIIKPTVETMGAKGVGLFAFCNGIDTRSGKTIDAVLSQYHSDFIVQKRVINHESIRRLYPDSVNTFRVITFLTRDGVKLAPLTMRIGVGGRIVDNGGIFIGVSETGELNAEGFSKKHIHRYTSHPDTGITFMGYRIEGVEKVLSAAVRLHSMLPQLKMLSWDMTLDQDGNIVIIEVNTTAQSVWFPQMVTGRSIFGEYTEDMLELIR